MFRFFYNNDNVLFFFLDPKQITFIGFGVIFLCNYLINLIAVVIIVIIFIFNSQTFCRTVSNNNNNNDDYDDDLYATTVVGIRVRCLALSC